MIIKTKPNALGSFSVASVTEQYASDFSKLLVEHVETGTALAGLPEVSLLDNSDLVTTTEDNKVNYGTATTGDVTTFLDVVKSAKADEQQIVHASNGSIVISPLGVDKAIGAIAVNFPTDPRTGLALPTTKLKKFIDFETALYENFGMVSAKQITMAAIASQKIRMGYMYHVESILMWYLANLNRVVAQFDYFTSVGPRIGMVSYAEAAINDEENQRLLSEIICNLADLPVFDVESYDRINEVSKYAYAVKKTILSPAVTYYPLFIGTTLANVVLTGLLTDGQDAFWKTTAAGYGIASSTFAVPADRCMSADILATALFATGHNSTRQVGVKALLVSMATHTASIKALYSSYFQYIRFAVSKGWIAPTTLRSFMRWEITPDGTVSPKIEAVTYSHSMKTFVDYLPLPMYYEGEANTAWARFHAPILLDSGTGVVNSLSALGGLYVYVDAKNIATKDFSLAEKASWGTWLLKTAGSTSTQVLSEKEKAIYTNPFDALTYTGNVAAPAISAAGVLTLVTPTLSCMEILMESSTHLNILPFLHTLVATPTHSTFESYFGFAANSAGVEMISRASAARKIFKGIGWRRYYVAATNVALFNSFGLVMVEKSDDLVLASISLLDLSRASIAYSKSTSLSVTKVQSNISR